MNPHPAAEVVIDLHHPQGSDRQDAVVVPWTRHVVAAGSREYRSLPIESGSVDVVYASHFLEHIPAGQPRLDVFNEARRVLRPGGGFEFLVPLTGWTEQSLGAKWAESSAAGRGRIGSSRTLAPTPTRRMSPPGGSHSRCSTSPDPRSQMSRHSPTTASRRFCLLTVVHAGRSRMVGLDTLG